MPPTSLLKDHPLLTKSHEPSRPDPQPTHQLKDHASCPQDMRLAHVLTGPERFAVMLVLMGERTSCHFSEKCSFFISSEQ